MKKYILLLVLISLLTSCTPDISISSNIEEYEDYKDEVYNSSLVLPTLNTLGDYRDISINYYSEDGGIYTIDSIVLLLTYSSADFYIKKEEVLSTLTLLDESIIEENGIIYVMEPQFTYMEFDIYVIDHEEFTYISNYGMIGFNEETYQIAFLYIDNPEIGSNAYDTMDEYMIENFIFELK